MAYTIEDYRSALAKAQAAGDDAAVADLTRRIETNKYVDAYDRASKANDIEATEDLAERYRSSRRQWDRSTALKDPMWVKNAKTLYKDVNKRDFQGKDEDAAAWLTDYMSNFNYRSFGTEADNARGMADIALSVKNFSPEGKAAFLTSMDDFDALPVSWEGTGEAAKNIATDPVTYMGLGVGRAATQAAKPAVKEGLKEAIKLGLKQTAKYAATGAAEGAAFGAGAEGLRETAEIGAGRRDGYDAGDIAVSGGLGAAVGGAGAGLIRGIGVAPKAAKFFNKLKVDDEAAAGRLAERFKRLEDTEGFDMGATDAVGDKGATQAIGTVHSEIAQEITDNARLLDDMLSPNKAASTADRQTRSLAQQALRTARTKEKAYTSSDRIAAVEQLVGHTEEGRRLVDLLKERNELYGVNNRGVKGGVSQYTDELIPFLGRKGRFLGGDQAIRAGLTGYGALHTGGASIAAQAGAAAGGRLIDAVTGRRSLPKLFMKQNLGNVAEGGLSKLPSVLDAKNADLAAKNEAKDFRDNLKKLAQKASLQSRMERQLQRQTDNLVRTRTGLNKQLQAEQGKALKEQAAWQKERTRLINSEQKAKTAADRQKIQTQRQQLDLMYKKLRVQQALEKQQAQQIVAAIGGPRAIQKAMKPLGKTLSDRAKSSPEKAKAEPKPKPEKKSAPIKASPKAIPAAPVPAPSGRKRYIRQQEELAAVLAKAKQAGEDVAEAERRFFETRHRYKP